LDNARRLSRNRAVAAERLRVLREASGGACASCGRKCDGLQFHHRVRASKNFEVAGEAANVSMARLRAEASKCDLMCRPCHDDAHHEERLTVFGRWASDGVDDVDELIPVGGSRL
jgi:hypothetical protein